MNIKDIVKLNIKKLKKYKSSARFLILPIAILVILVVIISSQVTNFREAARESVFSTIEEQNKLIELKQRPQEKGFNQGQGGFNQGQGGFNPEDLYYTQNDIDTIKSIKHIQSVQILSSVPISNITTSDLFQNIKINIGQLSGLDSNFAALYTDQDFTYKQGEAIPIILNANNFIQTYEDWGGKDEITITMARPGEENNSENMANAFPIKQKTVEYDKNSLIGKEITIQFGGLDEIKDYEIERGESGLVFKKLSSSEIEDNVNTRKDEISKYWDYSKISTPLEYKFKVVGIIEDQSNSNTFVPEDFVNQLMNDYIKNQLNARNNVEISTDLLGTTFKGIEYDGVEFINTSSRFQRGPGDGRGIMGGLGQSTSEGYNIPGLVIQVDREDNSNIIGEYKDADVYKSAVKKSDTLLIKIDDIKNRQQVISALNNAGYAYQDLSHMKAFEQLESTLNMVSKITIIAFIVLSIIIIIFTMAKFITEGKKEIGILRAVGAKKSDIKKIFITQAFIYVFVGYIIGLAFGVGLNYALSSPIKGWFDSFVGNTIKESFGVVNPVSASVFSNINFQALAIYSAILLVITIIVSLIPATKASNISPVEAIKNNE